MISSQEKRELRSRSHSLKPVVRIGQNGLTPAVLKEIEIALNVHELIKIRIVVEDKEERKSFVNDICQQTAAECVQTIGNILTIYRQSNDSDSDDE